VSEAPNDRTMQLVRDSVRRVLTHSPAWRALDADERRKVAHDTVKVARYMVDAAGETAGMPMSAVISTGLDRPGDVANLPDPRTAGQQFQQAGTAAGTAGSGAYTEMIRKVNFPRFVAGLVDGVFNAIVSSSIRQMEAYSTLVANVAKSVDEYMRDNISENQARDYLAGKYPQHLKVDLKGKDGPKLVPVRGAEMRGRAPRGREPRSMALAAGGPSQLPDFMKDLGLPEPITRLDPKTVEGALVPAARRRMAMDRQELLATMVLMGINRLIVTDGKISASCLFTLDTTDSVTQDIHKASSFDEHTEQEQSGWRFWFIPTSTSTTTTDFSVSTTQDTSSTADVNMHAQLSGNVDINFRSETFPLERMADILQIQEIEQKAPQAAAPATPQPPAFQLPPPPALPPLPGTRPQPAAPGAGQPATPAPQAP
jgi:hypothetical protein